MTSVAGTVRQRVTIRLARARMSEGELVTFSGLTDQAEHFACVFPELGEIPLVRMHSECVTGDILGSRRCDCGPQLDEALEDMAASGGVLLYLRQEGRGIGLYNKIDAYALQNERVDTFQANVLVGRDPDERDYRAGAEMLAALGLRRIRLMTNNPDKVVQLTRYGIDVAETVETRVHLNPDNQRYLMAKARVAGHRLAIHPAQPPNGRQNGQLRG
jgi:GTP cyclohydrolase II